MSRHVKDEQAWIIKHLQDQVIGDLGTKVLEDLYQRQAVTEIIVS